MNSYRPKKIDLSLAFLYRIIGKECNYPSCADALPSFLFSKNILKKVLQQKGGAYQKKIF